MLLWFLWIQYMLKNNQIYGDFDIVTTIEIFVTTYEMLVLKISPSTKYWF